MNLAFTGGRFCRVLTRICLLASAVIMVVSFGRNAEADYGESDVYVVDIDSVIDAVMSRFVSRSIAQADRLGAKLVILRINTPGGLIDPTREIITDILDSNIPIVSYVAPPGARAASAGTFIVAATGISAMAPATNIGAASPVGVDGSDLDETLESKAKNDAAAFMRSIAIKRDRNIELLEATVFSAAAYSAAEAFEANIVDIVAEDLSDLLDQLEGNFVPTASGNVVIVGLGTEIRELRPNFLEKVLSFLATPDVAFLLLSLGGLGIMVELWSPGLLGPGVVGVLLLILAFAGLGSLPFSWAGIVLIMLAFGLFFLETQAPGFGIFGVAGVASLIIGGIMLVGFFGTPSLGGELGSGVSLWMLGIVGSGATIVVLWFARELNLARRAKRYISPIEKRALIGSVGVVVACRDAELDVGLAGETWKAQLKEGYPVEVGTRVVVTGMEGLAIEVRVADKGTN